MILNKIKNIKRLELILISFTTVYLFAIILAFNVNISWIFFQKHTLENFKTWFPKFYYILYPLLKIIPYILAVLSILVIFILFITKFKAIVNKLKLLNPKVVLVNIILILVVFELSCLFVVRSDSLMNNIFGNTTSMWLTIWQNKPKNKGDLYSSKYIYDKDLGWTLKDNLSQIFSNDSAMYYTAQDGIRTSLNVNIDKDSNKIRIATIGDSYTECDEVANNQTWQYYLNELLGSKVEILNFGVGGYGHDQSLLRLQFDVLKYKPDIVLLGFVNPDISRNVVAFRDFAKPMYILNKEGKLKLKNTEVNDISYYKKNYLLKSIPIIKLAFLNDSVASLIYQEKLTIKIVEEMNTVCNKNKIDFKLIYIPTPSEIGVNDDIKEVFNKTAEKGNILTIDCLPHFQETTKKFKLKEEGHWDSMGNRIIAKCIAEKLFK